MTILLIIVVGFILMWIMPDEQDSEFEEQAIPFKTKGEWDKEENL